MESLHVPSHLDHDDPAHLLDRMLRSGNREPRSWPAPGGRTWVLEHEGGRIVLSLHASDMDLVCQASTSL